MDSTAVPRLNGYISGYGIPEALEKEPNSLGLSEIGKIKLPEIVDSRHSVLFNLGNKLKFKKGAN